MRSLEEIQEEFKRVQFVYDTYQEWLGTPIGMTEYGLDFTFYLENRLRELTHEMVNYVDKGKN